MYGLIAKITSAPNECEKLINILIEGSKNMPGNISYVVSKDNADANGIWITEIWENKQFHSDSLKLDSVQQAISKGKSLIAGFESRAEVTPVLDS